MDNKDSHNNIPGVSKPVVRLEDLGRLIRMKRREENLTLEQAAQQSDVSAATLSRWERQWEKQQAGTGSSISPDPDRRTLIAITSWLGVSLEVQNTAQREVESVPDIVEAHLRADRNLDPETASMLSRVFRAAYEQFAQRHNTTDEGGAAKDEQAEHE